MVDSILVTGGTGKTGRRVVDLLHRRAISVRSATRSPKTPDQVRFDWNDASSFETALLGVSGVYMVAPPGDAEPLRVMRPFIDRALDMGVDRLVLLSSSLLEDGGPLMGAVHAYMRERAPSWTVLRPSWFMQNFSEHQHVATIRDEGRIYSATGDGRVPFIDAGDIASVAVEALVASGFSNGDLVLTGPEALSYDDVARMLSMAAEREIHHHRLGVKQMTERFIADGIPEGFALALASMDAMIATGAEDRTTSEVLAATGRQPVSFSQFVGNEVERWRGGC